MSKSRIQAVAQGVSPVKFNHYRQWLNAIYEAMKEQTGSYSYAKLSADLALGSSNAHLIIGGKRRLSKKAAVKIADALDLNQTDRRYLLAVVAYESEKSAAGKDAAFRELMNLKAKSLPNELTKQQLSFFSSWLNAAILELLRIEEAQDDPEWIAKMLRPQVTVPAIKNSLQLLESLEYVKRVEGKLTPTEEVVTTGDEVRGLAIISFHQEMIALAKLSLTDVPHMKREISSLTLAIPNEMLEQMRHEMISLRKKFLDMAAQANKPDEIVQVNFQMFSLSRSSRGDS